MYRLKINFIFTLLSLYSIHAQKVSNVSNRQEQSNIIVSYDLETKSPCKIELYVSTNGRTTWQGPLKKVNGDVGVNISSGSNAITWNVLEEFDELKGTNIVFQIKADSNYETVKIGGQVWMKKNLDVTTYRNGDTIPEVKDPIQWMNTKTGAWCYYSNDPGNGEIYGKLYNWNAINDPRGLAPKDFHIPTKYEFDMLENNNKFISLPGGCRGNGGDFGGIGFNGYWWSLTEDDNTNAWYRCLNGSNGSSSTYYSFKQYGFSVRCIKNSK